MADLSQCEFASKYMYILALKCDELLGKDPDTPSCVPTACWRRCKNLKSLKDRRENSEKNVQFHLIFFTVEDVTAS